MASNTSSPAFVFFSLIKLSLSRSLIIAMITLHTASISLRFSNLAAATQQTSLGVHIIKSPDSAVAPKGDEVVFECELNLIPERLEWRFRHTSNRGSSKTFEYLHPRDVGYNVTNDERTSKLRVYVSPETLGDYQCVAWFGSAAITSITARLTLVSISIDNANGYSRNAIRWSVAPKNCILIRCGSVTSNPLAVWSFYRNGEKVPQTETLPTAGVLVLNSVSTKDSGNYTCSAMNSITGAEVQLPQRIDLRVDYSDRTPPHFLIQPPTQASARPGETIVLECPGVGSPPPEAVWSSPDVVKVFNNRTKTLPYGLQIIDVTPEDKGAYVCRLDNGISPALVHIINLKILEKPRILRGPQSTLTNEGDSLKLECIATGNPTPDIYWVINGEDTSTDDDTYREGGKHLVIKRVQKRHAGIVQCFARNEVGEVSEGNLLQVNPKQFQGSENNNTPLGNVPMKPAYEHSGKQNKAKRKHMKMPNMIPPSRPNVTRLSDDAVMLRWNVPRNEGLPIQFFKVQYRMLGDVSKKIPRENWQTTNEDIPYGKRDRNSSDGIKNFTSSVTGLKPDRLYRFRIIAVYSNNDNKEGNSSGKFLLQRGEALGPSKSQLPSPELVKIEALSENEILLHWTLPSSNNHNNNNNNNNNNNKSSNNMMIDGFYAYYRPASTAGEYMKATVDGNGARKFKIDMLEPGTVYEFKLQSFTASAASEFSMILQGQTKKPASTAPPVTPSVIAATKANEENNSIYPIVAASGGGLILVLVTIVACLCLKRRKNSQSDDEDKPQLDHIQADFVTPSVIQQHHKTSSHRLNGVMPRMNITPNPLEDADKNRNVMELRFIPSSMANATMTATTTTTMTTTTSKATTSAASSTRTAATYTTTTTTTKAIEIYNENDDGIPRRSSSCETLEATDGQSTNTTTMAASPLSKPLPPLPSSSSSTTTTTTASSSSSSSVNQQHLQSTITTATQSLITTPPQQKSTATSTTSKSNHPIHHHQTNNVHQQYNNLHSQAQQQQHQQQQQQQLQHQHQHQQLHPQQQVYHQTPSPTMMQKHQMLQQHHLHHHQLPPPVPPHQNHNNNNNINNNNHHASSVPPSSVQQYHQQHHQSHQHYQQQQQHQPPLTPSLEAHRRTLERSARNLHYPTSSHDAAMNIDGLPTRIPSLRRTRRTSGNANNNNGGVGIPIVPGGAGSPRVQRSPMPARAMMKRNRLGSHTDMSSGSLNSIEV